MKPFERFVAGAGDTASTARRRAERATNRSSGVGAAAAIGIAGLAAAAGAATAFLFDPNRGRARRAQLIDQSAATLRRAQRRASQLTGRIGSDVAGKIAAVQAERSPEARPIDDATLTDRVRSTVFRSRNIPKDSLNINVERGVVVLRGEVPDAGTRARLVTRVEAVDGVWSVRDLTHLPGEAAPAVPTAS